jgi:hypothetical protein
VRKHALPSINGETSRRPAVTATDLTAAAASSLSNATCQQNAGMNCRHGARARCKAPEWNAGQPIFDRSIVRMQDSIAIAHVETASLRLLRHVALTVAPVHNCLNVVNGYFFHMYLRTLIRHLGSWRATSQRAPNCKTTLRVRWLRGAVPLAVAIATITGCASKDGIRVPGPAATVSSDKAFALPPPGGPSIVNVVQHDFNNAAQQDIYLFTSAVTPGQNVMRVTFFGPVGLDYDDRKGLGYSSIRNSNVDRDMRRDLPGVAMAKSDFYVQYNEGAFG